LRYILLGLAGILLLVIAFFAFRLVSGIGSSKKSKQESQQTTESMTEEKTEKEESETLVRNQTDVLDLMTRYFTARADHDYDALAEMCEVFDDDIRSDIEKKDVAVEAYNNIMTYSKAGIEDGSYVVFVYFDAKMTGVDTLAPGLRELYLVQNSDGDLIVSDLDSHQDRKAYIEAMKADSDVQALIEDVSKKYQDALDEDEDLKNLINPDDSSDDTQDGDTSGSDDDSAVVGTQTGTMQTTTTVNVRGEASADSTLYGTLLEGTSVEVLENLDSGWSKVSYTTNGTTIEGYVMSQYLTEVQ
jgi:uncharacterized protein YgiM (DUF1202 family)